MKALYIIRHAKSDWDNPLLSDCDRPLNKRGKASVPVMVKFLNDNRENFDTVISSPANRAITTAEKICNGIGFNIKKILRDDNIYHANPRTLLHTINNINNKFETAALFGHNPGLTDLYNSLTGDYLSNLPTCGIAKIEFETESWKEVSAKTGRPIYVQTPKMQGLEIE